MISYKKSDFFPKLSIIEIFVTTINSGIDLEEHYQRILLIQLACSERDFRRIGSLVAYFHIISFPPFLYFLTISA